MVAAANPVRSVMTQFFNEDVTRVYSPVDRIAGPPVDAKTCRWRQNAAGVVAWDPACGQPPRRLLLDDDFARITFYDQKVLRTEPGSGRLIELTGPPGQARLKAVLRVPSGPAMPAVERGGHGALEPATRECVPGISGAFWTDEPATLVLRFKGGNRPLRVALDNGARVETLKPNVINTIRVPVPQGASGFTAQLEWDRAGPGLPSLVGAQLTGADGATTDLLY
jgi:hypothetical protein